MMRNQRSSGERRNHVGEVDRVGNRLTIVPAVGFYRVTTDDTRIAAGSGSLRATSPALPSLRLLTDTARSPLIRPRTAALRALTLLLLALATACGSEGSTSSGDPRETKPTAASSQEDGAATSATSTSSTAVEATVDSTPGSSGTTSSTVPIDLSSCTAQAVAMSLGIPESGVLEGPTCHDGYAWANYCDTSECIHAGHILRVDSGRWVFVGALLQDCAENFTGFGVPSQIAEKFFPLCSSPSTDPVGGDVEPTGEVAELIAVYENEYASCRGKPGTPGGNAACDASGEAYERLHDLGWCFGRKSDLAAAYYEWHVCGPDSYWYGE